MEMTGPLVNAFKTKVMSCQVKKVRVWSVAGGYRAQCGFLQSSGCSECGGCGRLRWFGHSKRESMDDWMVWTFRISEPESMDNWVSACKKCGGGGGEMCGQGQEYLVRVENAFT